MAKQWIIPLAVCILVSSLLGATQAQMSTITITPVPESIHILKDGTISPSTAPIKQSDNLYKATADINMPVVVERNNIVLNGQGFAIKGTGGSNQAAAINLTCTGVTVENFIVDSWQVGVLGAYDNNKIEGNEFKGNSYDIAVYGKNYEISQNLLCYVRIQGSNIHVFENKFQTRTYGSAFWISNSTGITIEANEFTFTSQTTSFISIDSNSNIQVYHNNFLSELLPERGQAYLFGMSGISDLGPWDNGYPSGGNYWIAFASKYGNASMIDDSGIWDTTFVISNYTGLVDRYPLCNPYEIRVAALPTPPPIVSINDTPAPSVPELPAAAVLALITIAAFAVVGLKRVMGKPMGTVCA